MSDVELDMVVDGIDAFGKRLIEAALRPFDLSKAPMIRVLGLERGRDQHIVLFVLRGRGLLKVKGVWKFPSTICERGSNAR